MLNKILIEEGLFIYRKLPVYNQIIYNDNIVKKIKKYNIEKKKNIKSVTKK